MSAGPPPLHRRLLFVRWSSVPGRSPCLVHRQGFDRRRDEFTSIRIQPCRSARLTCRRWFAVPEPEDCPTEAVSNLALALNATDFGPNVAISEDGCSQEFRSRPDAVKPASSALTSSCASRYGWISPWRSVGPPVRRCRRRRARPLADLSDFQPAELSDFHPALTAFPRGCPR